MAEKGHYIPAGQKHVLCQTYLLEHPEVVLKALFNGHHQEYRARLHGEYPTQVFQQEQQSPKVDIAAEITGHNHKEVVLIEIKGNTDDTRRNEALEALRRYRRHIDGDNGNPALKAVPITRGLAIQGYEINGSGEPTFRITPISFLSS